VLRLKQVYFFCTTISINFDMKSYPKISIVTVVLNDAENFLRTVVSVSQLTYKNIEYIVIDGGSTDGTLSIINDYKDLIDKSISEKDDGLYDAMNSGIDIATGEWVIFMNAGDVFVDNEILIKIFKDNDFADVNILYGDTIIDYPNFERYKPSRDIVDIEYGMQFSHQSAFIRLNYHKDNKYNINYKICADFYFFYNAYIKKAKFMYLEKSIAMIKSGGLSDKNREYVFWSFWRIVGFSKMNLNFFYLFRILDSLLKRVIKIFIPNSIINTITKKKWAAKK
jgi:hypothetical protein